jgi:acetylornithine deacetylase
VIDGLAERIAAAVDERRLVETAVDLVSIPSPTGAELAVGEYLRERFRELALAVTWQEVEEGRPNVVGTLEGAGGGPSLMFNGHLDTSYSGTEPWLRGIAGFQPTGFVRDGYVYGLGISNMKGAIACYLEAVRALLDAGVRLEGDVLVAAVAGEIEKTQWGDYRGPEYRGYGIGSAYLVSHGCLPDLCILGEPTEQKVVSAHFGAIWMRISTRGPFVHTAFSEGRLPENSIVRMRDVLDAVLEWMPRWEERAAFAGARGIVNLGCLSGGFPWRASRTPPRTDLFLDVRVPPSLPLVAARRELESLARGLRERFPEHGVEWEFYVSVPGAEIAEDHELVRALEASHEEVFGAPPEHETLRWTADSSVLVQHGIETVNYGTSSGLPSAELGENLAISGLVATAKVYALAAARVCRVA